jgi:hypothetical protein
MSNEMEMIVCVKGFEQGGYVIGQGFGEDFIPLVAVSTLVEVHKALSDLTITWDRQSRQLRHAQYEDQVYEGRVIKPQRWWPAIFSRIEETGT